MTTTKASVLARLNTGRCVPIVVEWCDSCRGPAADGQCPSCDGLFPLTTDPPAAAGPYAGGGA